jgi:NADH-ubiquinone oxidoreductase chain 5
MGGLLNIFPVSYVMILIGSLALVGFPFLTGFYSKDCILEIAVAKHNTVGNFCYFLGCSAAFCTSFYSFRLVFLTFVNPVNSFKVYIEHAHEAPITMIFPLLVLSLGALFYGYITRDLMIGLGSLFFNNIHTNYYNFVIIDSEFLPALIKNVPFIFTCFGAGFSLLLIHCFGISKNFVMDLKLMSVPKMFYIFLNKKWHFDQIVNELIVVKVMNFGYLTTFQAMDKGLIERLGPTGFTNSTFTLASGYTNINSGNLFHTAFVFITFTVFFILFFALGFFKLLPIFGSSLILLWISYTLVLLLD